MIDRKLISVVTPCYNEEGNVKELYERVKKVFDGIGKYDHEHIFIDNASGDKTLSILKGLAKNDAALKIIVNTRNFGAVRSTYHGLIQASGDAAVLLFADLQDPPEAIADFIIKWEEGHKVVKGIKVLSKENFMMYGIRSFYYFFVDKLSDVRLDHHFTGFGLYDKQVINALRDIDDPYPYLRGIIPELGFESVAVNYTQERRKRGKSANNFYDLYDTAMLGFTSHSKVPLRMATMMGFVMSFLSFLAGAGYLVAKLLFWPRFPTGYAPIIISIFFLFSVLLFFIGILGEYIGLMHMRILNRPRVIEKERVNF